MSLFFSGLGEKPLERNKYLGLYLRQYDSCIVISATMIIAMFLYTTVVNLPNAPWCLFYLSFLLFPFDQLVSYIHPSYAHACKFILKTMKIY